MSIAELGESEPVPLVLPPLSNPEAAKAEADRVARPAPKPGLFPGSASLSEDLAAPAPNVKAGLSPLASSAPLGKGFVALSSFFAAPKGLVVEVPKLKLDSVAGAVAGAGPPPLDSLEAEAAPAPKVKAGFAVASPVEKPNAAGFLASGPASSSSLLRFLLDPTASSRPAEVEVPNVNPLPTDPLPKAGAEEGSETGALVVLPKPVKPTSLAMMLLLLVVALVSSFSSLLFVAIPKVKPVVLGAAAGAAAEVGAATGAATGAAAGADGMVLEKPKPDAGSSLFSAAGAAAGAGVDADGVVLEKPKPNAGLSLFSAAGVGAESTVPKITPGPLFVAGAGAGADDAVAPKLKPPEPKVTPPAAGAGAGAGAGADKSAETAEAADAPPKENPPGPMLPAVALGALPNAGVGAGLEAGSVGLKAGNVGRVAFSSKSLPQLAQVFSAHASFFLSQCGHAR